MIREVDLVSYLPSFMVEFKEISVALEAENLEFVLVWDAAERVLKNEFIATADEYGISRFEKILGILSSQDDTLESRRGRVQSRWFMALPYTWRMLLNKLASLCGGKDFRVFVPEKEGYVLQIDIPINPGTEYLLQETQRMLDVFLPANICYLITGTVNRKKKTGICIGNMRSLSIKTQASPVDKDSHTERCTLVRIQTLVFSHIKAIYKPQGGIK